MEDNEGNITTLWVFSGIFALLCGLWTWYQLRYFARTDTPSVYYVMVMVSWWLGVVGVAVLLPLDMSFVFVGNVDHPTLLRLWKAEYWITFFLSWVVNPIAMEYWAAGDFTVKGRAWTAVKENLLLYIGMTVVLITLGLIVSFTQKLSPSELSGFVLAAANCYGMILIVTLIGYGIIGLPRVVWMRSKHKKTLDLLYFNAPVHEGELLDAEGELVDIIREILTFERNVQDSLVDPRLPIYLEQVKAILPEKFTNVISTEQRNSTMEVNVKVLSRLHGKLKRYIWRYDRAMYRWNQMIHEVLQQQEQVAEDEIQEQVIHSKGMSFRAKLRYVAGKLLLVFAICMSIMLFWCELTIPIGSHSLSIFGAIINASTTAVMVQFTSIVPLAYIAACAYVALFKFKLLDTLALYGNQQTEAYCLLQNASYLGRLQFALGVHFSAMVHPENIDDTVFIQFIGKMDVVNFLGTSFNTYIPLLIVLIAIFTWFRIADKVLNALGIEVYESPKGTVEHHQRIIEGKELVERAIAENRRSRSRRNSTGVLPVEESSNEAQQSWLGSLLSGKKGKYPTINNDTSSIALTEI